MKQSRVMCNKKNCTLTYVYICMYMHIYTHIQTYMCIYIHMIPMYHGENSFKGMTEKGLK